MKKSFHQAVSEFLRTIAGSVVPRWALAGAPEPDVPDARPLGGLLWQREFSPNVVVGGRGGNHQPFEVLLPRQMRVTAVYVTCHDEYLNVTKAILRLRVNRSVVLLPDWQDVKRRGSTLLFESASTEGVPASSLEFISHHIGHLDGDDETVLQKIAVYGFA